MDAVSDEKLEAHIRKRITPEMVEFLRRRSLGPRPEADRESSSAYFNYALGVRDGKAEMVAHFERLLTEAQDPENT
ncbi:hypothetical protein [Enhydrobacter aerosaccus]|nr:hypothetical protein [Enhydrobacter aerosaccus]